MKKILLFAMMALSSISVFPYDFDVDGICYVKSEEDDVIVTYQEPMDTIYMKNGNVLLVNMLRSNPNDIEYSFARENAIVTKRKKEIQKIVYRSGRIEYCSSEPKNKSSHKGGDNSYKRNGFFFKDPLSSKGMFYLKAGIALNTVSFNKIYNDPNESYSFIKGEALDMGYSRYIGNSNFYWAVELGLTSRGYRYECPNPYYSNSYYYDNYFYVIHHGLKFSPIVTGYRFQLPNHFAIDPHLGCFFAYYYQGIKQTNYGPVESPAWMEQFYEPDYEKINRHKYTDKPEDVSYDPYFTHEKRFNAGLEIGTTIWYRRFCFDITYQLGFCSFRTIPEGNIDVYSENYPKIFESLPWKLNPNRKSINHNLQFKLGIAF